MDFCPGLGGVGRPKWALGNWSHCVRIFGIRLSCEPYHGCVMWRSFAELHTFTWNQLAVNQSIWLFNYNSPIYWFYPKKLSVKNVWIRWDENSQGIEMLIIFFIVAIFLRYYQIMQLNPVVERVNGDEVRAHGSFQLFNTDPCANTCGKIKGSHPGPGDLFSLVPRLREFFVHSCGMHAQILRPFTCPQISAHRNF